MKSIGAMLIAVAATLGLTHTGGSTVQEAPDWQVFDIDELRRLRADTGRPWREFLRSSDLYAGVYELAAGTRDGQGPHDADEVYFVIEGSATVEVEGERSQVGPGAVIYVAKDKTHRFVEITEDLSLLVFFATPGGA